MHRIIGNRSLALALAAIFLAATVGCAHVNREELDTDLETMRTEMRAEREASASDINARIDEVAGRVDEVEASQREAEERMARLEASLTELETELGVTIERLENAIAFSVPLYFEFDSATIVDNQTDVLDRFAGVYSEYYAGDRVTVEGFTDEAGSEAYNMQLGRRRAEEVKSYLTEVAGMTAEQVRAVSYGESPERLISPGEYGHSRGRENRRVVLVIDGPAVAATMTTEIGSQR